MEGNAWLGRVAAGKGMAAKSERDEMEGGGPARAISMQLL